MKIVKNFTIIIACSMIISCGDEKNTANKNHSLGTAVPGNSSENSITGPWVTEKCEQLQNPQGGGLNLWVRGYYSFNSDGALIPGHKGYADNSCTGNIIPTNLGKPPISLRYNDIGAGQLENGKIGRRLKIDWVTQSPANSFSFEILVWISDKQRLCLPRSFNLGARSFSYSADIDNEINYDNCLTRVAEPAA